MSDNSMHPDWLDEIHDPGMYPHPVSQIRLLETHISWVILTGDWVYKLKKPVNFGFVDFSTLELRHAACREELRLNRRTAAELYDEVVPLTSDSEGTRFGGTGFIREYAVRMRQFPQEELLDQRLSRGSLSLEMIDTLALEVADLHRNADVANLESPYGNPDLIGETVQACLDVLEKADLSDELRISTQRLISWITTEWNRLNRTFVVRKRLGLVRECHGDLHLGNLVYFRGRPMLFDCLEFNPRLRWIDVISDVAFLVMDLHDRKASPLAWRVLNEWLEQTGDYDGLEVLKYYIAYRALVRAKVAAIRLTQPGLSSDESRRQHTLLESYVELAGDLTEEADVAIVLMHGLSGSGKSYVARQLAMSLEAIRIRSDVERKRLYGGWPSEGLANPSRTSMYSNEATRETYLRLLALSRTIVEAGYRVVVDAAFLKRSDRKMFIEIAADLRVPLVVIDCRASVDLLRERITHRQGLGCDPSDASVEVLETQRASAEELAPTEALSIVSCDTTLGHVDSIAERVEDLIRSGSNRDS